MVRIALTKHVKCIINMCWWLWIIKKITRITQLYRDLSKNSKRYYFRLFMICKMIDAAERFSINKKKWNDTQKKAERFENKRTFHSHTFCPPILFDVHFNIDCYLVAIKRMSHQNVRFVRYVYVVCGRQYLTYMRRTFYAESVQNSSSFFFHVQSTSIQQRFNIVYVSELKRRDNGEIRKHAVDQMLA